MYRVIAHLLVIFVLVTNVAWAVDDCFSQYSNEVSGVALPGDSSSDSQNDDVCDELCIGWLHLVAITSGTKLDDFPFTRQEMIRTDISFHSLDKTPPIQPPQS